MQLSALSSQLSGVLALTVGLCLGDAVRAQNPPFMTEFSTHDATTTAGTPPGLWEVWADVKSTGALMPGKGWTFTVGTVEVKTTRPADNPKFSGADIFLPPAPVFQMGYAVSGTIGTKQVVVLQARGPDLSNPGAPSQEQTIRWQRFFYGESGLLDGPIGRPATNARAISVWPVLEEDGELDEEETRIAICGESYECHLPLSQFNGGNAGRDKFWGPLPFANHYPRGLPSGFVAVYRGNGELLWTHQFCYLDLTFPTPILGQPATPEGACAITDVSIRVELVDGVLRDVVTYCGISSFGVRDSSVEVGSLTPRRPFDLASTSQVDGAVHCGLGQWDGIVGRLSNVHTTGSVSGTATLHEFHSVVGGAEQDGLWGLHEMPGDRFVVVGSTATSPAALPTQGPGLPNIVVANFPFTHGGPPTIGSASWPQDPHCVGTMLVFDASQTRLSGGVLQLEEAVSIGRAGALESQVAATVVRDVHVAYGAVPVSASDLHRIAIVGSTNDSLALASVNGAPPPLQAFGGGGSDGFLLTAIDSLLPGPVPPRSLFVAGTFQGEDGNGGWCGVDSWGEFLDHIAVLGWVQESQQANKDLECVTFVVDTQTVTGGVPGSSLVEIRRGTVSTPAVETPAALGEFLATDPVGPAVGPWDRFGLDSPAGGGVAMDERGRIDMVGSTDPGILGASSFPVIGGVLARNWHGGIDAVRLVATMLPDTVGRTDRSGQQLHLFGTIPVPPPSRTGATTPTCALLPFGPRLDGTFPLPGGSLRRMLIDWQGPAPAATPLVIDQFGNHTFPPVHFLWVDRPPSDWIATGLVVQFGLPTAPPALPTPLPSGIENWVPSGVATFAMLAAGELSVRIPLVLPPPPSGGVTFSAQAVAASLAPLSCSNDVLAATPAIVFSY